MQYIKSHSNYVYRTRHKITSEGTIFERDITTIGGRNQFAPGQVPIYKSGNFIITINNTENNVKDYNKIPWTNNQQGKVWTLESIENTSIDETASHEDDIVIKNDIYDLSDFAYFGSCSEMVRASINNILKLFPGELFTPYDNNKAYTHEIVTVKYDSPDDNVGTSSTTLAYYYNEKDAIEAGYTPEDESWNCLGTIGGYVSKYIVNLPEHFGGDTFIEFGTEIARNCDGEYQFDDENNPILTCYLGDNKHLYTVDNPFEINIHDNNVSESITDENPEKYFTNDCYHNFVAIDLDGVEYEITYNPIVSASEFITFNSTNKTFHNNTSGYTHHCPINVTYEASYVVSGKTFYDKYTVLVQPDCDYPIQTTGSNFTVTNIISCDYVPCMGDKIGSVTIHVMSNETEGEIIDDATIYVFMGDDGKYVYLVDEDTHGLFYEFVNVPKTIEYPSSNPTDESVNVTSTKEEQTQVNVAFKYRFRPKKEFFQEFLRKLDEFERILVNTATTPTYSATFRVIDENDLGYYDYFETFTFPTTYGGYNLGNYGHVFDEYVRRLSKVSEFYDEHLSDNIYRSLTHEAIKNFDWTYFKGEENEVEEKVNGISRIANILRIYGRLFDNIKIYADSISNIYTITYDNVNNLPDYFFTDTLENYGWDLNCVIPLTLHEYKGDNPYHNIVTATTEEEEKTNTIDGEHLHRMFTSCDDMIIAPYSKTYDIWDNGYFYGCNKAKEGEYEFVNIPTSITFNTSEESFSNVSVTSTTEYEITTAYTKTKFDRYYDDDNNEHIIEGEYYFDHTNSMLKRIVNYSSEKKWTMPQVNNEFMKRLIINSPDILRHKGTIASIEMICSLFGMKSKRWYDLLPEMEKEKYKDYEYVPYDFDVKEYTLFTKRLRDPWSLVFNGYTYDTYNMAKTIQYDTEEYRNGIYIPYQGIMAAYRYSNTDYESLDGSGNVVVTTDVEEALKDSNGNPIRTRYIYPDFQKNQIYDGNVYYQMNGGWLSKSPFIFDKDNNILCREKVGNRRLYKETIRNIVSVSGIKELFSLPLQSLDNGSVVYVDDLSVVYAIVDGIVYDVNQDYVNDESYYYVEIEPYDGYVVFGNTVFENYIIVSTPYGSEDKHLLKYNLSNGEYDGMPIRVYIFNENGKYKISAYSETTSISTFTMFMNGSYMEGDDFTHYFRINNIENTNELSVLGWQQLTSRDYDFYRINSLQDYFNGNNPHTGHMRYDNGHEYLTYLRKLFRYSYDNEEFNYDYLYENGYMEDDGTIEEFGFKGIIKDDLCDVDYDDYIVNDNKIHFFGDKFTYSITNKVIINEDDVNDVTYYITDLSAKNVSSYTYSINEVENGIHVDENNNVTYNLQHIHTIDKDSSSIKYGESYSVIDDEKIDGVTNQIINTKRFGLTFYLRSQDSAYNRDSLEEIKYIDSVVLPYIEQVIPSTIICDVNYIYRREEYYVFTVCGDEGCEGEDVMFYINDEWKTVGHIEQGKCVVKMDSKNSEYVYNVKLSNSSSSSTLSVDGDTYYTFDYLPKNDVRISVITSITCNEHVTVDNDSEIGTVEANGNCLTFKTQPKQIVSEPVTYEITENDMIESSSFADNVLTLNISGNETENDKYATITFKFYDNTETVQLIQTSDYSYATYTLYVNNVGLQMFTLSNNGEIVVTGNIETNDIYVQTGRVNIETDNIMSRYIITYSVMSYVSPNEITASITGTVPENKIQYDFRLADGQSDRIEFDNAGSSSVINVVGNKILRGYSLSQTTVSIPRDGEGQIESTSYDSITQLTFTASKGGVSWLTVPTGVIANTAITVSASENTEDITRSGYIVITGYDEQISVGMVSILASQTSNSYVFKFADGSTVKQSYDSFQELYISVGVDNPNWAIISTHSGEFVPVSPVETSSSTDCYISKIGNESHSGGVISYTYHISKNVTISSRTMELIFEQAESGKRLKIIVVQSAVVPDIGDVVAIDGSNNMYILNLLAGDTYPYGSDALGILVCPENVIDEYARIMSIEDVVNPQDGNYTMQFSEYNTFDKNEVRTFRVGIPDNLYRANTGTPTTTIDTNNIGYFGHEGSPYLSRTKRIGEKYYYDNQTYITPIPLLYNPNTREYNVQNAYSSITPTSVSHGHIDVCCNDITLWDGNVLSELDGEKYTRLAFDYSCGGVTGCRCDPQQKMDLIRKLYPIYAGHNYKRLGTTGWYLPTIGEIGIVAQFLRTINDQLSEIGPNNTIDTSSGQIYWSCVPAYRSYDNEDQCWAVVFNNGYFTMRDREKSGRVRAFKKIKIFNS